MWEPLICYGLREIEEFIEEFEEQDLGEVRIQSLDITLKATIARCWGTNKKNIQV